MSEEDLKKSEREKEIVDIVTEGARIIEEQKRIIEKQADWIKGAIKYLKYLQKLDKSL